MESNQSTAPCFPRFGTHLLWPQIRTADDNQIFGGSSFLCSSWCWRGQKRLRGENTRKTLLKIAMSDRCIVFSKLRPPAAARNPTCRFAPTMQNRILMEWPQAPPHHCLPGTDNRSNLPSTGKKTILVIGMPERLSLWHNTINVWSAPI